MYGWMIERQVPSPTIRGVASLGQHKYTSVINIGESIALGVIDPPSNPRLNT